MGHILDPRKGLGPWLRKESEVPKEPTKNKARRSGCCPIGEPWNGSCGRLRPAWAKKRRRNPAGSCPRGNVSGLRGIIRPEQVRLAREALEISPDCADAYVLLAEHAKTPTRPASTTSTA